MKKTGLRSARRRTATHDARCELSFQEFAGNLWAKYGMAAVDFKRVYAVSKQLLQAAKSGRITWFGARVHLIREMKRINEEAALAVASHATRSFRANRPMPR